MPVTWFDGVTFTLEVAWASSPSTAIGSSTFTDESARVRDISARRGGRSDTLDTFQAGTMSVTLANADRRFDPNHATGVLFGKLLPMRRARWKLTYAGVTYDLWSGFLSDLPQVYDIGGNDATVTLLCTDAFKVLALLKLPESVYGVQLPLDSPTAWWRLGESSGTQAIDSSGNKFDGTYIGGATFHSTAGLIFGGADSAIAFDGVSGYVELPRAIITAYPFTVEGWVSFTGASGPLIYGQFTESSDHRIFVSVSNTQVSAMLWNGVNPTPSIYNTLAACSIADGLPHHVAVVFTDGNSDATVYVDGVAKATTNNTLALPVPFPSGGIGYINGSAGDPGDAGTIDEVAVYASALSAGTVAAHYGYGATPWEGDTSGARIGRLLDLVAVPAADRAIATGVSTIQAQALANQPVLKALQDIEISEQGQLYIDAAGKVVFRDRHWRFENTVAITSQATFRDTGSLGYCDVQTDGGETLIFNRVRASRDRGATIDVSDPTSVDMFYERTDEVSGLQNESDLEVRDLATWRLATHKNPVPRITVLEIRPRSNPATLIPIVLARDIGHRITVTLVPQDVGATLTFLCLIEGIEHSMSVAGDWVVRWYLSSADCLPAVQPLILDDVNFGKLDANVLAY